MRPTRARLLVGVLLAATALGWAFWRTWERREGTLPSVPWSTPLVLAFLAAGLLATALVARPRLQHRPGTRPVPPLAAARLAALALASSRAGAAVAGGYLGFLLVVADDLDEAFGRRRAVPAGAAVLASLALVGAALLLERACRVRPDEPGPEGTAADGATGPDEPAPA